VPRFSRILRPILNRFADWKLERETQKRHRLAENSWRTNQDHLATLRAQLAPGQKLVAIMLVEHFGDIIACEPVIRYLRREHPRDCIIWILRENYQEILSAHPDLNAIVKVTCLTEALRLAQSQHIDLLVDLHVNLRRCSWLNTLHQKSVGETSINVENYYLYGSLLESFCRSAGLPPLTDGPRLYLPETTGAGVAGFLPPRPFYIVHAGSNEFTRDWTPDKWHALFEELPMELQPSWIEVGLQSQVARRNPSVINLCGQLSLAQLAEVIRRSSGFIGVDSGPAHMANAFKRPAVILLGRYRAFDRYMPYTGFLREHADEMIIHWQGAAAEIPVDDVVARVRRLLKITRSQTFSAPHPAKIP
jgi:heptosyltransferase-3